MENICWATVLVNFPLSLKAYKTTGITETQMTTKGFVGVDALEWVKLHEV